MNIDNVHINFSADSLFILNLCLAFLMFGVALDIKVADFKRLFQEPKTAFTGLFSEYILLPILTILLIYIFQPQTSLALGMVLIACCPGGSTSNFMVHLSGANSALSVLLTSVTTLGAIVITPLAFAFWSSFVPTGSDIPELSVEPARIFSVIFQLIFIPVSIGIFVNEKFNAFAEKIKKGVRYLSILIFFGFVVGALHANWDFVKEYLGVVFGLVLVHNTLAFLIGYLFAKSILKKEADVRAISIETGIQNTGLGLILIFNFFDGLGGMAMITAWWGVWHLISGFGLAMYWRKIARKART